VRDDRGFRAVPARGQRDAAVSRDARGAFECEAGSVALRVEHRNHLPAGPLDVVQQDLLLLDFLAADERREEADLTHRPHRAGRFFRRRADHRHRFSREA